MFCTCPQNPLKIAMKRFILSGVVGQSTVLNSLQNELLHEYFSRSLNTSEEHLF